MISRFFKKKPKIAPPKKEAPERPKAEAPKEKEVVSPKERTRTPQKLLTAEGWKRIMMRKMSAKGKK